MESEKNSKKKSFHKKCGLHVKKVREYSRPKDRATREDFENEFKACIQPKKVFNQIGISK